MTDLAVIMSVYQNDRLTFLKKSVQSILDQTFTQFHYYLIFDGPVSTDIENYVTTLSDERIRLFRLEMNSGLATALNFLLEQVLKDPEYKFIARMDADDISLPSRFEKQQAFLMENPEISLVGCWYQEIDESGKHLSDLKLPVEHEALKKRYYTGTPFAHPSVMYRRSMIERVGFYPTDTVLMEDNVLWGRAIGMGLTIANIPEYLLQFRVDNDFYRRRSGIKYGWNYCKTRFFVNRMLNAPFYVYFFSLGIGVLKILPAFLLKFFYQIKRKLS